MKPLSQLPNYGRPRRYRGRWLALATALLALAAAAVHLAGRI